MVADNKHMKQHYSVKKQSGNLRGKKTPLINTYACLMYAYI